MKPAAAAFRRTRSRTPYVDLLYRQPIGDTRQELPVQLVRRILYAIYRRGYRVKYPLARPAFRAMLDEIEDKSTVGVHPAFGPAEE